MVLKFLHLIESLKTTKRAGWLNENVPNSESIADHMYRMGIIVALCEDTSLDQARMQKIALIHDMAEAIVGDITPRDNVPKKEKQARELAAMQRICNEFLEPSSQASKDFMQCFLEYEHKATPEARFVKDVDKYELILQTIEYEKRLKGTKNLKDFTSSCTEIEHPQVKKWVAEAMAERKEFWASFTEKSEG